MEGNRGKEDRTSEEIINCFEGGKGGGKKGLDNTAALQGGTEVRLQCDFPEGRGPVSVCSHLYSQFLSYL